MLNASLQEDAGNLSQHRIAEVKPSNEARFQVQIELHKMKYEVM